MIHQQKCDVMHDDFVDASFESISAKWSSLAAPLLPSLILSRDACSTLFETPWRTTSSPAIRTRRAALHLLKVFENDVDCQKSWLVFCGQSLQTIFQLSAGEIIGWTYTFIFLIATMVGASSVSSALGVGSLVYRLYLVGCAQSFVSFIYEMICLLQDGPVSRAKALIRAKAKTFVLTTAASMLLPRDVLAAHMTACVLFGFMEMTLKCLFRLTIPCSLVLGKIKEMGNSFASRVVSEVLISLNVIGRFKALPPPPLLSVSGPPEVLQPEPSTERHVVSVEVHVSSEGPVVDAREEAGHEEISEIQEPTAEGATAELDEDITARLALFSILREGRSLAEADSRNEEAPRRSSSCASEASEEPARQIEWNPRPEKTKRHRRTLAQEESAALFDSRRPKIL